MSKKHWKLLLILALVVVMVFGLSAGALADDETPATPEDPGGTETIDGLVASKHIHVEDDGTYTVNLEAFSTGEVHTDTVAVPADIILVLDVSGSMAWDMTEESYKYTPRESQGYSYNGYGNNTYYYKSGDNYYAVERHQHRSGKYSLRYSTGWNTYVYLWGTGTSTSQPGDLPTNGTATIWTGVLYERETIPAVSRLDALKDAVAGFIDEVAANNKKLIDAGETDMDKLSRIAIVKFAGNLCSGASSNYTDYASYIGDDRYDYNDRYNRSQVVADLGAVTPGESAQSWKDTVDAFSAGGATHADYGMGYANAIINAHKDDHNYTNPDAEDYRSRVVVMFTDGAPTSGSSFEPAVANSTITTAGTIKGNNTTVYTVAVLDGANPALDPTANGTSNENKYLHAVSSNYPSASSYTPGTALGTRAQGNYYFAASSADELAAIFKEIGQSSGSTSTPVSAQSVMKDIVSSSFTLPIGATQDDIHISIVRWNTTTRTWGTGTGYVFTPEQWATECLNYGAESAENVTASVNGDTVDITGFDYKTHYKATTDEQDKDNTLDQTILNANTAKIVVSFRIIARTDAVTGGSVATNGENSGIYIDGEATEPIIHFTVPEVTFTPVTYVVDYVTSDTSTDTKASTIKLDYSKVLDNVTMLDKPDPNNVLIGEYAVDFEYTIYQGNYGTISFGDDATDVQRRYVRYAPTTMNWDGYDRIFIKGKSASDNEGDVWAMLAVIPANSVFYEDTYITQTKTVEYGKDPDTGKPYEVEIVYTGIAYTGTWNTVGTEGTNQTQHAGDDMGWITGLADDSGYANDMAHTANAAKAKATFTVTGTGVDIYSRTNGGTGTVSINIKSLAEDNESGKRISKTKIIDTKAAAGDFFAVPVCTFTDLPYGKYTVTITVTTGGQAEGRMTFYLDGVRVYNPIQPLESDDLVQEVYRDENMGAVFTEVRSLLGNGATAAALYIDEHTTSEIVTDVAAIEAAAKALAEAQDARDKYVESTITPAKNAVSAEEYALSSAQAAVTNATNIYDAMVDAYNEAVEALAKDPENAELQAAVEAAETAKNNAQADVEAAQADLETAQDHYDANIGTLQADLDAAIAGRATYDAAVEAARTAYDEANDGVIVGYNTEAVVADYDKDGPLSELYLSKNQQVAINVEAGKTYYIGLRSLNGGEVTATVNGRSVTLSHTVDLYYEATPESGPIVIKNTGDSILSITKLRTTGVENTTSGTKFVSTEETMSFVRSMAAMAVTPYTGDVLTEEEAVEEPVVEEPIAEEPAAEPEVTVADLEPADIVIENPEPTETEAAAEEPAEEEPAETAPVENAMSKILSSFFNFFRRR